MSIDRAAGPGRRIVLVAMAFAAVPVLVGLVPQSSHALPQQEATATGADDPTLDDLDRAHLTTAQLLEVGRALSAWSRDTRIERGRKPPTLQRHEQVRWNRCPAIDHAELEELLVPAYLRELPEKDAWERPLEFCLDRRLASNRERYGVRSAGSDGTFEPDLYEIGPYAESRLESDMVWMDGAFARWPEPQ